MKTELKNFQITAEDAPLLPLLTKEHRDILAATGSYAEIAAAHSLNIGTVKGRINRARLALIALRSPQEQVVAAE